METGYIASRDGTRIFYRLFVNPKALGVVVLTHGFAEHTGRYLHVVAKLQEIGFHVLTIDLRGHGYSDGKRGYIDHFNQYLEDIDASVGFAKKQLQQKKVILLGHSMGGLVVSRYASENAKNLHAIILSSPLFGIKVDVPQWKRSLSGVVSKYVPMLSMPSGIDPNYLSHDVKVVSAYEDDSLIFQHARARWFTEIQRVIAEAKTIAEQIRIPVLLQASQQDEIVDFEKEKIWFSNLAAKDKTMFVYEGFYHEIYQELEREKPLSDLCKWLHDRFSIFDSKGTLTSEAKTPSLEVGAG